MSQSDAWSLVFCPENYWKWSILIGHFCRHRKTQRRNNCVPIKSKTALSSPHVLTESKTALFSPHVLIESKTTVLTTAYDAIFNLFSRKDAVNKNTPWKNEKDKKRAIFCSTAANQCFTVRIRQRDLWLNYTQHCPLLSDHISLYWWCNRPHIFVTSVVYTVRDKYWSCSWTLILHTRYCGPQSGNVTGAGM